MKRSAADKSESWPVDVCELVDRGDAPFPSGLRVGGDVTIGGAVLCKSGTELTEDLARWVQDRASSGGAEATISLRVDDGLRAWAVDRLVEQVAIGEGEMRECPTFGPAWGDIPPLADFLRDVLGEAPEVAWKVFCDLRRLGEGPVFIQSMRRTLMAVVLLELMQEHGQLEFDPVEDYGPVVRASLLLAGVTARGAGGIEAMTRRTRVMAMDAALATFDVPEEADPATRSILVAARRFWAGGEDESDDGSAWLAKTLVMAEALTIRRNRFFHQPAPLKTLVEEILQARLARREPTALIESIARGFSYAQLFDFYREIDAILEGCDQRAGSPHPVRPGVSATLVLCRTSNTGCRHFGGRQTEAVWIAGGDLPAGCYGTCRLMTPRLQALYIDHYDQIKGA